MKLTVQPHLPHVSESSPSDDSGRFHHVPVLSGEVVEALQPAPGKIFVDGTLGGGGHAGQLLAAGAQVIGLDQDDEALAAARHRLTRFGDALHIVRSNFREIDSVLDSLGVESVDGILLDIGVSSHQLDIPGRGFSFQNDGPLDMRMDRSRGLTAADWVNASSEQELIRIFREYGEEPSARRIAQKIVARRLVEPFARTADLAATIEQVVPRRGKRHPATRVFQALRMAVNDELGALEKVLELAPAYLAPGARFAIITFHSLEDRIVKNNFRSRSQEWLDRPEWPAPQPNPDCLYRLVHRKSIEAGESELLLNPRARSARLRVVEKLNKSY